MRFAVALGAAVVFVAPASAGLPNPCGLLTNAEVTKAPGSKIETRELAGNALYRSCKWIGTDLGGYYPAQRTLLLQVSKGHQGVVRTGGAQGPRNNARERRHNVYASGYALEVDTSLAISPIAVEKSITRVALKRM